MHVVANTIIPAQSDTYRHLQTRVTDLLADSGQTPSPTNPRPNPRLAHTTEIFTNPLIPAENALTVNHLVNRPGFAGGSSWGDDVDHGPEDEVYARGIRTWTGFSAICPMWTPDVRSGDIREVRITVATGLGTIGVAGSPAVLATLARDHECRGARVRSTTRLPPTLPGLAVNALDKTWQVRESAAKALSAINARDGRDAGSARKPLLATLSDPEGNVRRAAVRSLTRWEDGPDVAAPLRSALADPDADVRAYERKR